MVVGVGEAGFPVVSACFAPPGRRQSLQQWLSMRHRALEHGLVVGSVFNGFLLFFAPAGAPERVNKRRVPESFVQKGKSAATKGKTGAAASDQTYQPVGDGGVTLHRGDELRLELGEDLRELVLALALHAQAVEQRLLGRLGEESRGELSQGDGNQGGGVGGGEGRGGEGMGARGRLQHVVGGGN